MAEYAPKRMQATGRSGVDGCGAISRSPFGVGRDGITSPNGRSGDGRRNPPVLWRLRLSCTRPSTGLRSTTHGSNIDRGITLTFWNSWWAFFGRSPPRIVMTRRMMVPRGSSPPSAMAEPTMWDSNGFRRDDNIAPRHEHTVKQGAKLLKEGMKLISIVRIQDGKPRQRCAFMAVERWRNSPDAAPAGPQFALLDFRILHKTIGWIGDTSMDRGGRFRSEPIERIGMVKLRLADDGHRVQVEPEFGCRPVAAIPF